MPVRFVIGRSGTGKTAHCVRAIVDAARAEPLGPPIFWVLPRQATFSAERQLTTESGLPAVCRVQVLSFDELAKAVLADCGGAAIPLVDATGRRVILSHLLRQLQPQLKFFGAVAHHPGLAATLDATFAEFERSGNNPEQVLAALESQSTTANDADDLLYPKLSDLRLLYEAYTTFLGQDRLDPHRRNEQVVGCMKDAKLLRDAAVYVDGFYDFTESERRMIVGLATTCRRVEVTILTDPDSPIVAKPDLMPDEGGLFHRTEDAYRRLAIALRKNGAKVEPPVLLREVRRFESGELGTLERGVFGPVPPVARTFLSVSPPVFQDEERDTDKNVRATKENPGGETDKNVCPTKQITFTESNDRPAEVDAAARHILDLLRDGHRMRDVAVLVRNLDAYQDLIDASFREHGVAFFLDRRRTASHHPLLRLVRALLQIATDNWPAAPLLSLMKTGLAGLSLSEADELENYVHDHRIRAAHWPLEEPWQFGRLLTRDEADETALADAAARAQRADMLRRRVVDAVGPFVALCATPDAAKPLRIFATELYAVLARFNVATTLSQWAARATAAHQFDQAGEHQQVWAEFIELLDQLVELLGDHPVTPGEFTDLLDTTLDTFDLALTPATIDQVLVGQVDRTRLPDVKATIVLGLSDGEFPRVPREDSVLSDRDRSLLRQGDLEIKGDGQRQLLDERLLAYSAFTSPSHSLYLSRVACDPAGKEQAPSPYWSRLRAMFPDAPLAKVGSSSSRDPRFIATPRQLIVSLMRWARDPQGADDATHAALYHWLATHPADGSPVAEMRYRAWGALSYANESKLSPETAAALFASPLEATVNRLEAFAACPFQHFAQYGLRLHARRDDAFSPIDLSRIYHNMLERIVKQMIHAKQEWRDLTDNWTDARIAAVAREVDVALKREMAIEPGRSQYLLSRIERTVRQVVKRQRVVSTRTNLSGGYVGISFGGTDGTLGPLKVTTPRGRELHVRGRIDRIDLLPGSTHAAVFDYKLKTGGLSPAAVYNGLSLQLLTYLLVLQANGHELAGTPITPAAGFYLQLMRGYDAVAHPDEAPDPATDEFHFAPKARGVLDATHLSAFDNALAGGASPVVQVHVNKEGGFGYRESSDVCDADEFLGLLDYVRGKLAALTDAIVGGDIRPRPYRLGKKSPCAQCGYKSLCRFDVTLNGYNIIGGISRDELLTKYRHAAGDEDKR